MSCWRASILISDRPKSILQFVAYERRWKNQKSSHWIVGELCTLWVGISITCIWIETHTFFFSFFFKEIRHHPLADCRSGNEHQNSHSITIGLEIKMKRNLLLRWKLVSMTTVPNSGEKLAPICQPSPEGMNSKFNKFHLFEVKQRTLIDRYDLQKKKLFQSETIFFYFPAPWLKLTEYDPVFGSCCIWKLLVERPNGFKIIFPRSLSFPIISAFKRSFRSSTIGVSRAIFALASTFDASISNIFLWSAKLSSNLSDSSYNVARLKFEKENGI